MRESLCTRCRIGTPRELRASTMCRPRTPRLATAAQSFEAEQPQRPLSLPLLPQSHEHALRLPLPLRRRVARHPLPFVNPLIIIVVEDVISIIICRLGTACFLDPVLCRPLFEAFTIDITTMQSKTSHPPSGPMLTEEDAESASRRSANPKAMESSNNNPNRHRSANTNANPNAALQHENIENAKLKSVKGIVSSPDNPATIRRLSQDDSSNTVSWHKRVVVHRVPRSDASRSMFVSSSQSKEGLSSQCCIIV